MIAVVGVALTVVADKVLIPAFGGKSGYYWDYYASLGPSPSSALWHIVRHPLATLHLAMHPHAKIRLLSWLFGPLGFVSLGSSFVLLAVPLLAERLLSSNPNHWTLTHQYSAPFVPILTLAAVDTVGKLVRALALGRFGCSSGRHRRRTIQLAWLLGPAYGLGILIVAVWACRQMPFDQLTKATEWRTSSYEQSQRAAVDVVPNGVTVEAEQFARRRSWSIAPR